MIFVFGSNLAGIHGAGAARYAYRHHGAVWGVGEGRTGNAYALPTKEADVGTTRSLEDIALSARRLLQYAQDHPELEFQLTAVGCGLAGYSSDEIAPLFRDAPLNVKLPPEWAITLAPLPRSRFWSY